MMPINFYQGPGQLYSTRDVEQRNPFTETLSRLTQERRDAQSQQNLADMAAQRMSALGPQGQYWAEQIRRDPRAALALAGQYGGFAEIENSILGARKAGEAQMQWDASLQGSSLTPIELEILRQAGPDKGPAALKAYRDANGGSSVQMFEGPDGYQMRINPDGTSSRIPGQGAPIKEPTQRKTGKDSYGRLRYLDDGSLVFAGDENAEPSRFDDLRRVDKLRADRKPVFDSMRGLATEIEQWEAIDWANPANDAQLAKRFVQQVEPGLQVTEGEGRSVVIEATSRVGRAGNFLKGLLSPAGTITDAAREYMIDSINDSIDARARAFEDQYRGLEEENSELFGDAEAPARESMAGSTASIRRIRKRLSKRGGDDADRSAYDAAVQALRDAGIPDDQITSEAVADLLEGSRVSGPAAPKATAPRSNQPGRMITPDEIRWLTGDR